MYPICRYAVAKLTSMFVMFCMFIVFVLIDLAILIGAALIVIKVLQFFGVIGQIGAF